MRPGHGLSPTRRTRAGSSPRHGSIAARDSCSLVTNGPRRARPFDASRPRPRPCCARCCPGSPTRSIAAIAREVPGLRPRDGGRRSASSCGCGVEVALQPLRRPARRPGGRRRGGARRLRRPRPRRVPRRPQPRRAARRLPRRRAARVAAVRRGRASRPTPAGGDLRARRGDLRLHRRALGRVGRGLRRGAVGRGGRERAPPPPARAAARPGPAGRRRRRSAPPPRPRAGRCRAAASRRSWPPRAERGRARRGACGIVDARRGSRAGSARARSAPRPAALASCSCPTPTRPGAGAGSRRRSASARRRSARPSPWAEAAPRALRRAVAAHRLARRAGSRRAAVPEAARASPRTTSPTLLLAADPGSRPSWPPPGSRRWTTLADGPRARLTETLRAWLDRPGQVQAVAAALGRAPADRPLPAPPAARPVRRAAGGSGRALRARARPSAVRPSAMRY